MQIHCGESKKCLIWEDWWLEDKSLQQNLPRLYNVCFDKNLFVADVLGKGLDHVNFRRTLLGESLELWNHIEDVCVDIVLIDDRDVIKWTFTKKLYVLCHILL